jgi:hypothetical protein
MHDDSEFAERRIFRDYCACGLPVNHPIHSTPVAQLAPKPPRVVPAWLAGLVVVIVVIVLGGGLGLLLRQ